MQPFPDLVWSLMGIILEKCLLPVKNQIIHELSWPPQDSVNDHIDPETFWIFYTSFNDAVSLVIKHGEGTLSTKVDLANAFKHVLVRSQAGIWIISGTQAP